MLHFLGGKWTCVHIDDPRSPLIKLPSLSKCLKLTPSEIIEKLILKRAEPDSDLPSLEDVDIEVSKVYSAADVIIYVHP